MDLSKYTQIELVKMCNDLVAKHEMLKKSIIDDTILVDELQKRVESQLKMLDETEKKYVAIIDELNKR